MNIIKLILNYNILEGISHRDTRTKKPLPDIERKEIADIILKSRTSDPSQKKLLIEHARDLIRAYAREGYDQSELIDLYREVNANL